MSMTITHVTLHVFTHALLHLLPFLELRLLSVTITQIVA